jgi:two-component system chemotaxis response regulator CheY
MRIYMDTNKPVSLLVVDDSLIMRKAIIKYLEGFHLEIVGTANNGDKALTLFREHNPDVVTLDITMPGIDGLYVLQEMVRINKSAKVIVITALSDKETGLKAINLGAKSYLSKPFSQKKLQDIFEKTISRD